MNHALGPKCPHCTNSDPKLLEAIATEKARTMYLCNVCSFTFLYQPASPSI